MFQNQDLIKILCTLVIWKFMAIHSNQIIMESLYDVDPVLQNQLLNLFLGGDDKPRSKCLLFLSA